MFYVFNLHFNVWLRGEPKVNLEYLSLSVSILLFDTRPLLNLELPDWSMGFMIVLVSPYPPLWLKMHNVLTGFCGGARDLSSFSCCLHTGQLTH